MIHENRMRQVLTLHPLTESQEKAVKQRGKDLIVTAGAGSGKTRTLVARYLALLAEEVELRKVAAITFTEKATREMRNRVRLDLQALRARSDDSQEQTYWEQLVEDIDGARIGTIHGLCAEILRTHPAEAGLDPEFEVLDEGLVKLLKLEAAENALAWAVEQEDLQALFAMIETRTLNNLLAAMLDKRLDYLDGGERKAPEEILLSAMEKILETEVIGGNIQLLREMQAGGELEADAKGLAPQLEGFLAAWGEAERHLQSGNLVEAAQGFYTARRNWMDLRKGPRSGSVAKESLRALRGGYDALMDPWIGGASSKDALANEEVEQALRQVLPLFAQVFDYSLVYYQEQRDLRRALDFDDLEYHAQRLIQAPRIQAVWQGQISHLMVDEFQDTNQRQRDIVLAIAGDEKGNLFLVGDAQQSIYRFRGADVEVFVEMQALIESRGGTSLELETTFRSHKPLLDSLDALLSGVIGTKKDPDRPYAVPYLPMHAFRQEYEGAYKAPFVEFVLGAGEDAELGRIIAARGLADKLISMKVQGEINSWDEVALLFRASGGFAAYEDAFSLAGIPFVTVAGIGFYHRPEIRDILNILTAFSNPWDDSAMVGMLRSPAVGLTDANIYRLRIDIENNKQTIYAALQNYQELLPASEQRAAAWTLQIMEWFIPLANHIPVADLLTRLVNFLDYRAILMAVGVRVVRNLDKLLEDARESDMIQVSAFLEYLTFMRESGVRSGEAITEAQDSVQLMTIHKSKGLEFPLVVLADAGRGNPPSSAPGMYFKETGMVLKLGRMEQDPMLYKYARMLDKAKEEAEAYRLLYVACTRDQEKLIISGHVGDKGNSRGYLKLLGVDYSEAVSEYGKSLRVDIEGQQQISLVVHAEDTLSNEVWGQPSRDVKVHQKHQRLYKAIVEPEPLIGEDIEGEESELKQRDWRTTGSHYAPAVVVGKLVHKSIQRWQFPGNEGYLSLMNTSLVREGIVDQEQRELVLSETKILLGRFIAHGLYQEIVAAKIHRHEIPYAIQTSGTQPDTGVIDLLYKNGDGWQLVDFKTDELSDKSGLAEKVQEYTLQLSRYQQAATAIIGSVPQTRICFLDFQGQVKLIEVT